jgi:cell division protein FtsX
MAAFWESLKPKDLLDDPEMCTTPSWVLTEEFEAAGAWLATAGACAGLLLVSESLACTALCYEHAQKQFKTKAVHSIV